MRRRDLLKLGAVAAVGVPSATTVAAQAATKAPGDTAATPPPPGPLSEKTARETILLDADWRFHHGDIPFPKVRGDSPTYDSTKAGAAGSAGALVAAWAATVAEGTPTAATAPSFRRSRRRMGRLLVGCVAPFVG